MELPEDTLPLELDVRSVSELLGSDEDVLLLDCREPAEFEIARLEAAQLMPMGEIPQRVAELEPYRQRRIVVHCHHGGRSLMVTEWLRAQGFPLTQNMSGGIDAWSLEIDKSVPRY